MSTIPSDADQTQRLTPAEWAALNPGRAMDLANGVVSRRRDRLARLLVAEACRSADPSPSPYSGELAELVRAIEDAQAVEAVDTDRPRRVPTPAVPVDPVEHWRTLARLSAYQRATSTIRGNTGDSVEVRNALARLDEDVVGYDAAADEMAAAFRHPDARPADGRKRVYVASSWRNTMQQGVVHLLRAAGHDVYDFKHPAPGDDGFSWREVSPDWQTWDVETYRACLDHPVAAAGFANDWNAMVAADVGVLVLPSGRSAHIEAGYFVGAGKPLYILLIDRQEPELMYRMATRICTSTDELLTAVGICRPDLADDPPPAAEPVAMAS